jgi:hypothetical protein
MVFFWLRSLSLGELFWAFVFLNLLFWGIFLIRVFWKSEGLYYLWVFSVIFWLVGGLSFGLKWYRVQSDDRGVIVDREARVLSGPHPSDTVLFKLHEGTIVHEERSEDGWVLIKLTENRRGWVSRRSMERIRPEKKGGAPRFNH